MTAPWLDLARKEIGTKEWPGPRTNPTVGQYYVDASKSRQPDSVPWCAAFTGAMLERCQVAGSGSLMARSYLGWGQKLAGPVQGAVVVFARGRPPSGHVAFVESFTSSSLTVVGGNQGDAVTRKVYPRRNVLGFRWPSGVPMTEPKALQYGTVYQQQETNMADMTPKQIMDLASKLHSEIDDMGYSQVRPNAKKAAEALFYLAKYVAGPDPKTRNKTLKGPAKRKARRKARRAKRQAD